MNLFVLVGLSVLGILLMLGLLRLIDILQRKPSKGGPLVGRPEKPLKDFAQQAGEIQISLRVARETYDLLIEHYPTPMCIDPQDELRRDLSLSDDAILQLVTSLLKKTDRTESDSSDVSNIRSVSDLLHRIESAKRDKIDRAALRLRATDCPYPVRPVVEVIEFKRSSEIIDPDYLRRQHFRWLRRRISDYKGLLSRATDEASKSAYQGPFRRSHEGSRYPSTVVNQRDLKPRQALERIPGKAAEQTGEESRTLDSTQPAGQFSIPAIRIAGPEYPSR